MKVTVKELRRIIREYVELSPDEAREKLSTLSPEDITDEDWGDADTGEIYLQPGDRYGKHPLHPDYSPPTRKLSRSFEDSEDNKEFSENSAQNKWNKAAQEYAESWTDYSGSEEDDELQGAAVDAAQGFFSLHPEWKSWSVELGMSKSDMMSAMSDFIYDAMISGQAPNNVVAESRRKIY